MFRITNSTLKDRIYLTALAYIKIVSVISVKQMVLAVKFRAKIIWKKLSSFIKMNYHIANIIKHFYTAIIFIALQILLNELEQYVPNSM